MLRRWEWALMLVTAFAVRVAAGILLGHFAHPFPWEYETIADNLLAGNGYVLEFLGTPYRALCPPGYPFFCAAVYAVTGHSHTALILLQCLLGALICIPVRQIGLQILPNPSGAVLGSWAVALHPSLIHFASRLHTLTLDVLLYLLCLWAWLEFHRKPTHRRAGIAGLASGMAYLFRSTILPFILLAAALSARLTGLSFRAVASRLGQIFLIIGLLSAPWLLRNAVRFHRFPMMMSGSHYAFWIGNNPESHGEALLPDGKAVISSAPEPLLREIRQLDEMGQSRLFQREAWKHIRRHPFRTLALFGRKLKSFFWFSPRTGILYPGWCLHLYRGYYTAVAALALLGLWTLRRRLSAPPFVLLFTYIFSIAVLQGLVYVEGRHRWTVEPLFLLFAAQGILFLKNRPACASS